MSFFKRLKDKLFTLNIEDNKKEIKVKRKNTDEKKKKKIEKSIKLKEEKFIKNELKTKSYIHGLTKSSNFLVRKFKELRSKNNKIDEEFFENLEEILIMADINASLVMQIIYVIKKEIKINNYQNPDEINDLIIKALYTSYTKDQKLNNDLIFDKDDGLSVFLVVGVNGVGKTTTIAKLAHKLKNENKKVLLAAADTFRAGAVEQLKIWAKRVDVEIVYSNKEKADPSSVVFDAIKKANQENYDVLIIDTAGRLQNKINLMNELQKIKKIIKRELPNAPHESLLVMDATNGQNGINQATIFKDLIDITGIALTKMDGTSKGGIVLSIKDKLDLEVKYIGFGEKIDDLKKFDINAFIYGLTKEIME